MIGIGTRYSDFTTRVPHRVRTIPTCGSSMSTSRRSTRSSNGGLPVVADAREAHRGARGGAGGLLVGPDYRGRERARSRAEWDDTVPARIRVDDDAGVLTQSQVIGLVNTLSEPSDVVVCAAGSMPGRPAQAVAHP